MLWHIFATRLYAEFCFAHTHLYLLRTIVSPHQHDLNFGSIHPETDFITNPMQPGCCRVCGKSSDEVQFSNSQRKRLKKGQAATCKGCASPADSSGSAAPSVVAAANLSPDGAKAVTVSTSSKVSMVSGEVIQCWLGRWNLLPYICVVFMGRYLIGTCTLR